MSVTEFEQLKWSYSAWLCVADIGGEEQSSLIVEYCVNPQGQQSLLPTVNYKNKLYSQDSIADLDLAQRSAWSAYLDLKSGRLDSPPITEVYVRTGSDGFVDELEQLP